MDIFELITNDHEKVLHIFEQLEKNKHKASKNKESLFEKLHSEIEIHATAEEHTFYPALQQFEQAKDKVIESLEEHHVVRLLLSELQKLDKGDEHWDAKLSVLKENIEHHMSEEEGPVFDMAQDFMDEEQLDNIATQFQKDKKEIKAHA